MSIRVRSIRRSLHVSGTMRRALVGPFPVCSFRIAVTFGFAAIAGILLLHPRSCAGQSAIPQLVGEEKELRVRTAESAYRVARSHGVSALELVSANELRSQAIKRGKTIKLPTWHIPPLTPGDGIVLNVPERAVYVFRDGKFLKRFPAAVGKPSSQTALGTYKLRSRVVNPTWTPPRSMVINEGVKDEPVPPGPGNPLGDRWMGWSKPGFGFHSTLSPRSIGRAASHGCVRLYPEGAREMFRLVRVGMPIYALYKPALIGKSNGVYYLSLFPDVYRRGGSSISDVRKLLAEAGVLPLVDDALLKRLVARKHSSPQRLVGNVERIEVNGEILDGVRPALVNGTWMAPVNALASALTIVIEEPEPASFRLTHNSRALEGRIGDTSARSDGAAFILPIAPVKVDGNLYLPLRAVLDLTGAQVKVEKGKALRITTETPESPS